MKPLLILVLAIGAEAHAQTLADFARAERLRQQSIEAVLKVKKIGERPVATEEAPKAAQVPETKTEVKKELTPEEKLRNERVDIIKKRSELLVRMGQFRDDAEAVRAIEMELMELSKRAEAAKLQHLGKNQTATER